MQIKKRESICALFEPRSIAVFGSLKESWNSGYGIIKNLLDFGYKGKIYPINPTYNSSDKVLGYEMYHYIREVPDDIDLAIIIIPPVAIPDVIEQCGEKGVKSAIVMSEGFAESGEEGRKLQTEIVNIARRMGVAIIGPNTAGIVNTSNNLVTTSFYVGYKHIKKGVISYIAQTGVVAPQGLPLEDRAYPISKICDLGNKCDLDESDLLEYLGDDPDTQIIAMHIEDIKDGRKFMNIAHRITLQKPVIVLKSGRTTAGSKAVASHTGSLATDDKIYDNALKQAGALRVYSWEEFLEAPKIFAYNNLPQGNKVAIITNTGACGILAADLATQNGLIVTQLSQSTTTKLRPISHKLELNPVDIGQTVATSETPLAAWEQVVASIQDDENVDCLIIIYWSPLPASRYSTASISDTVETFRRLKMRSYKPMAIWVYGPVLSDIQELSRQIENAGLPTFSTGDNATIAMALSASYSKFKSSKKQ